MDYGVKGSPPGFDVRTAVDYLLSFNSSWPLIKIHYAGSATINMNSTPQTIYTHNLGYPPLYMIVGQPTGNGTVINSTVGTSSGIGVDNSVLGYDGSAPIGGTFTFDFFICRVSLTSNFSSPNISGDTSVGQVNNDYGFKLTKPGADVSSSDLRNFSLHSGTRSIMLSQTDNGATTSTGTGYFQRIVSHNLGYLPIALSYARFGANTVGYKPNYYYLLPPSIGVGVGFYQPTSSSVISTIDASYISSGTPDTTAVVFKDPLQKSIISRTYP